MAGAIVMYIKFILLVLPIIYMALIWLQTSHFDPESVYSLSSQISMSIILLLGVFLELAHLFEFGLVYLFLIMAFLVFGKLNTKKEFLAATIAILYGLIDEIHQLYVPFRSFSYGDLFKDAIGVLVISFIIHKSYFTSKKSKIGLLLKKITNISQKHNKNFHI
jgi:polysaccharide biosynthesis protein VpsQ